MGIRSIGRNVAPGGWQLLADAETCRLTEVPRPAEGELPDRSYDQRFAAVASAYHAGTADDPVGRGAQDGTVLLGWCRTAAERPVEVYVGSGTLLGADDGHDGHTALLRLPAGARGRRLAAGGAARALEKLACWQAIGILSDGLLLDDTGAGHGTALPPLRPALEDCLLRVWQGPFAWVVLAQPVGPEEAGELTDDVADRLRRAQTRAENSPERGLEALRLTRRHQELARAASTGLWRVRLLAGGEDQAAAARIAGLVCASADLTGLPYALAPAGPRGGLEETADAAPPVHAGSALLTALARPPQREIPGVRFALRPEFDVQPEPGPDTAAGQDGRDGRQDGPLRLGTVLDAQRTPAGEATLTRAGLNRHTFVCGATGSGKSQTVRSLLSTASAAGLPWLVIEPAKAEYRFMAARLRETAEVIVIRPGDADGLPAGLNPLEPSPGPGGARFPLQTHLDMVRALFLASFEPQEPFPQILGAALTRAYEELGWDLTLGEPLREGTSPRYPALEDLQHAAERVVTETGYGREVADNVRGFIRVRIAGLRQGTTGRFLEGGHPIDFGALLRRNVVLEIEDVGDDNDKAFLMGTVLIRLVEHLRLELRAAGRHALPLRHLSVFEEAHRLLRHREQPDAGTDAVEMFAGLLAEIRAYGEGLVIAEQIPRKLVPDVIKNTATKIVHRLPARDDREAVGATMNITPAQSDYLVTLPPGEAAVFTDGMDYPLLVRMPDGTAAETAGTGKAGDAGELRTGSPAPLLGRRSPACGDACAAEPCPLRLLRRAQRLAEQPRMRLALWAETAVAAHLLGWQTPLPGPEMRAALVPRTAGDRRVLDCALGQAADRAVASRPAGVGRPGELAAHVAGMMRAQLAGQDPCPVGEPEWAAQPGTVTREYFHGRLTPSVLERLVGCTEGAEEWNQRYVAALSCFERPVRRARPSADTRA